MKALIVFLFATNCLCGLIAFLERQQASKAVDLARDAFDYADIWRRAYETGQGETQAVCISMRK